eukprot:GHVO01051518.1.p1 GENE.GHVO01051518.1~~GHVO01051518.1.p1  ORF type:complete len:373 (-),score=36.81 GHVO01051518.1:66-1184(-)
MGRRWRQLGLLLWKNYLLQRRRKLSTFLEVLLPLFFSFLLILIRKKVDVHDITVPIRWNSFSPQFFPEDLYPHKQSTFWSARDEKRPWKLYFSPNGSAATEVMNYVKLQMGPSYISDVIGFEDEDSMTEALVKFLEEANGNSSLLCDVLAAVPFTSVDPASDHFSYSIRLTSSPRNKPDLPFGFNFQEKSNWKTREMFPVLQKIGPRQEKNLYGGEPGYMREGFLTLQHHIDIALMRLLNVSPEELVDVQLQRQPYPPYLDDNFVLVIQQQLPTILLLSFVFTALQIVKEVVHEKERKLKESMKMMGLSGWLHWTAWFIKYLVMLTISIALITALLCSTQGGLRVIGYTNAFVVFVFLLAYSVASIAFCFMV